MINDNDAVHARVSTPEELSSSLRQILKVCREEMNFQLPLILVVVSKNGCALISRYTAGDDDMDVTVLTEHTEEPGYMLPINIMITDSMGKAANVLIDMGGPPKFLH